MLFRVYPVFLCNQRCCSTTQWPHSDIVLSNFAGETIILQAPKQEPHYQLSRSRPKGKKNVRNRPGRLPATAGTFRRSAPGSHSACATSRRPCSRSRPSCPGGSVNKQTRLWKVWSRLQPLPHSLGHKTRVHWSPGWFSESDRTGGCCQMCVTCHPRPQCRVWCHPTWVRILHCPLPAEPWAGYLSALGPDPQLWNGANDSPTSQGSLQGYRR